MTVWHSNTYSVVDFFRHAFVVPGFLLILERSNPQSNLGHIKDDFVKVINMIVNQSKKRSNRVMVTEPSANCTNF